MPKTLRDDLVVSTDTDTETLLRDLDTSSTSFQKMLDKEAKRMASPKQKELARDRLHTLLQNALPLDDVYVRRSPRNPQNMRSSRE